MAICKEKGGVCYKTKDAAIKIVRNHKVVKIFKSKRRGATETEAPPFAKTHGPGPWY
jgi:hypothetical protein